MPNPPPPHPAPARMISLAYRRKRGEVSVFPVFVLPFDLRKQIARLEHRVKDLLRRNIFPARATFFARDRKRVRTNIDHEGMKSSAAIDRKETHGDIGADKAGFSGESFEAMQFFLQRAACSGRRRQRSLRRTRGESGAAWYSAFSEWTAVVRQLIMDNICRDTLGRAFWRPFYRVSIRLFVFLRPLGGTSSSAFVILDL